jgi:limonene-1,2-epoxide hydrolase
MVVERTPEATVRAFAAGWSDLDFDRIADLLHPDIHYHNIPMTPLSGKAQVEAYLRSAGPFESCRWILRELAVSGDRVLTERVDEMVVRGTSIVLPVMGVFVIERGRIIAWRDYFDLASYRSQWPAEVAS